jgi:hypothetical protein
LTSFTLNLTLPLILSLALPLILTLTLSLILTLALPLILTLALLLILSLSKDERILLITANKVLVYEFPHMREAY